MKFTAEKSDDNLKVGFFLSKRNVSRRLVTKLKRCENGITLNGSPCRTIDTVHEGDLVEITMQDGGGLEPNPELSVKIAFENESLAVFDKPSSMPVHPSIKHQGDTLGNYFASLFPDLTFRPVNRLDRDTSGLCIVAKNPFSAKALQFSVKKTYFAAVCGQTEKSGTIDLPIAREKDSIIKRIVSENGQKAVTHFEKIAENSRFSLLKINLETGRTHQIRVHFSHIGHPLVGDTLYGSPSELISRQALHCGELTFPDPISGELITVKSDLPDDMKRLFEIE